VPLPNDEVADCMNQAHIFVSGGRINPQPGKADTRPLPTIVTAGLNPQFNDIDLIQPLAATIFHEVSSMFLEVYLY
jgi:hypothetical protein